MTSTTPISTTSTTSDLVIVTSTYPYTTVTYSYLNRSNIGPLLYTFTPPTSCAVAFGNGTAAYRGQTCSPNGTTVVDAGACWPSPTLYAATTTTGPFSGRGFYSPGLYCPAGYTSACFATYGGHSDWSVQFPLTTEETAVGCCPTSFSCNLGPVQTCLSVAKSTFVQTATCSYGTIVDAFVTLPGTATVTGTTSANTPTASAQTTTMDSLYVYAPMIQINYRSQDGDYTLLPSVIYTSYPSSGDLSGGAIAGIAVASVIAVVAFLFAAWLLFRNERMKRKLRRNSGGGGGEFKKPDQEQGEAVELSAERHKTPVELPTTMGTMELPSAISRSAVATPVSLIEKGERELPSPISRSAVATPVSLIEKGGS